MVSSQLDMPRSNLLVKTTSLKIQVQVYRCVIAWDSKMNEDGL